MIIREISPDSHVPRIMGTFQKHVIRLPFHGRKLNHTIQRFHLSFRIHLLKINIHHLKKIQRLQPHVSINHPPGIIQLVSLQLNRLDYHLRFYLQLILVQNSIPVIKQRLVRRIHLFGRHQRIVIKIHADIPHEITPVSITIHGILDNPHEELCHILFRRSCRVGKKLDKILREIKISSLPKHFRDPFPLVVQHVEVQGRILLQKRVQRVPAIISH